MKQMSNKDGVTIEIFANLAFSLYIGWDNNYQ